MFCKTYQFRLIAMLTLAVVGMTSCGGSSGGGGGGTSTSSESDPTAVSVTASDSRVATLSTSTVGQGGGTITSSDLTGFEIEMSQGAVDENITFTVTVSDVDEAVGLPDGTATSSRLIQIEASGSSDWNEYRLFNKAIKVTLPYDEPAQGEATVRYYVLNPDGTLEPTGFEDIDTTNNTITFYIRSFADSAEDSLLLRKNAGVKYATASSVNHIQFIAVGMGEMIDAFLNDGVTLSTGFNVSHDGWYIPNYGSYYKKSRGGNCMGMVSWAKYWFRKHGTGFYNQYRDEDNTSIWVDDAVAIELASRAHEAEVNIWNQHVSGELNEQDFSAAEVAYSYIGGLYVTNQPVLVYIIQSTLNADGTKKYSGHHAIMIHGATISSGGAVTFNVYDPNFPNSTTRTISYTDGVGFTTYSGGPDAQTPGYQYNLFKHFGYNVAVTDAVYDNLKVAADDGFDNASVFPVITTTSIVGKSNLEDVLANEDETEEGEPKFVTSDTAVTITGTVLGGLAQTDGNVVNNINVFVGDQMFSAAVDNQAGGGTGAFTLTIPVKQGENEVVFIASRSDRPYSHWSAFKRMIIESTASAASLTVTMSWSQGESDIDLYVKEPDFGAFVGDTVYYQHRKGASTTNPYLDFDNTSGYGPEHYYAKSGMSSLASDNSTLNPDGLYGTYGVKVHYYADHDSNTDEDQIVSWSAHYRYLAYCEGECTNPEEDGFWEEGEFSGTVSVADSGDCCDFDNSGASWSDEFTIEYPVPDADSYVVPASHEVMLP